MTSMSKVDLQKIVGQIGDLLTVVDQKVKTGDVHQAIANANVLLTNLNTQLQRSDLPGAVTAVRNLAGGATHPGHPDAAGSNGGTVESCERGLARAGGAKPGDDHPADETTADLQAQLTPVGCLIPALYPNRWSMPAWPWPSAPRCRRRWWNFAHVAARSGQW